ncbi:flagellar basal body-associated protein FliL [Amycolatopsis albispora]|uniref:Flagellar basal body-associated protein FliL n=1 Tax=Amycolatopsis albispora TaxID=1804986 RepID=A0A344LD51_9PSEU|nr:flagellar basal body-associated protein FliL [Amycolatopsis albispora]AXB45975.1 hypothetical protein A4R43_28745 [Amycolatopsis albispora]
MSWQEELRKLDEELASGRLSADDYRIRRDQVLSSAVAPGENPASGGFAQQQAPQQQPMFQPQQQQPPQQPQPQQQPPQAQPGGADATQVVSPVSPPQGTPQPNSAEATQIVPSADPGADRTQAVPRWQTQAPPQPNYQQPGYPQQPPNSPAGGFAQPGYQPQGPHSGGFNQQHPQQQQQPQPGWNQPEGDLSPPWGGSEFPPLSPASSSEWTRQGPELFEESSGKGKGGKVALLALVALLVVGGLVTGGILLFSGDEEPNPPVAQSSQAPPPPPSSAPPTKSSPKPVDPSAPLIERIPAPPGTADSGSGKLELAQLGEKSIMDGEMVSALNSNGATEAAWRGSVKGADANSPYPDKFSITAVRLPDAEKAQASLAAMTGRMDDLGYIAVKDPLENIPSDVQFYKDVNEKKAAYYGVWVSQDVVIQVHVSLDPLPSPANDAEAAMSGSYQRQVIATLANFPVSAS